MISLKDVAAVLRGAGATRRVVRRAMTDPRGAADDRGRISHQELLETARDVGVTPVEVEEAIVAENRVRAEALVREAARQRELRTLLRHVATYVIVGAFSYVLDVRLTGGVWYFWVLLGWGLVLTLHVGRAAKVDRRIAARVVARKTGEPSAGEGPRDRPGASGRPRASRRPG